MKELTRYDSDGMSIIIEDEDGRYYDADDVDTLTAELKSLLREARLALKVNGDVIRTTTIGKIDKALEVSDE